MSDPAANRAGCWYRAVGWSDRPVGWVASVGRVPDADKAMKWLIARLKEGSTWRGLVWLLTVGGVLLTPEQTEAIVLAGMALAGVLGVFLADDPKIIKVELPSGDLVSFAPNVNRLRELSAEFDAKVDGNGFGDK